MKKLLSLLFAVLCLGACMENELQPEYYSDSDTLYASMESIDATRTSMDEYNNVLWSEEDQLVAFMKTTLGIKYQIKEQYVGTTTGGFSKVQDAGSGDDLESGQEIDHNVVLYPHSDQVWCMKYDNSTPAKSYKTNVVLPETQTYAENSFANGAFPMVAVSTNNQLTFKNICGGVKLQFKGVDKIKSIKLEGLGNEAISGKSSVIAYADGSTPTITMAATASKSVILDCGDGVQLNESTPTTFIIAVPPVTFSSGMKITITDTDGLSKTLTNSLSNTIKRSSLLNFPVITYKQNGVLEFPEGAVTSYEVSAEGGTIEIPVVTNLDYQVVIPEDAADWISVVETRALRQEVITLNISENATAEERSAEVLITTTSGLINQTVSLYQEKGNPAPQPGDYVDEYGINHGQGIKIGETVWAPVNCGYHKTDYKYGKLYQWGRKFGQGYDSSDATTPTLEVGFLYPAAGSVEQYANIFYYDYTDWASPSDDKLWNSGSETEPIKTKYDPCPEGWRVPTNSELYKLSRNKSSLSTVSTGQKGYWVSGEQEYSSNAVQIFLPAAGHRAATTGNSSNRNAECGYWSSATDGYYAKFLCISNINNYTYNATRPNGYSVRCVLEASVEPSVPEGPANNEIWYTSSSSDIITPSSSADFGAKIVSNTYDGDYGVITFDGDVTKIGDEAFYWKGGMTSITLPSSVTTIGNKAFDRCFILASINIPQKVTTIGNQAFYDCRELQEITIPNSVSTIGYEAFFYCENLISVTVGNGITAIGSKPFGMCQNLEKFIGEFAADNGRCLIINDEIIAYANASGTEFSIPNSVTTIGDGAFYYCNKLTSVTLPDTVTEIRANAFAQCTNLTSVNISDGVTSIGFSAFSGCLNLADFVMPDSVTQIKDYAFDNCSSLSSITIPSGVSVISRYAFCECSGLLDITISNGVTSIGEYALYGCSKLTRLILPDGMTEIEDGAFQNCTSLEQTIIPNSITSFGYDSFYGCTGELFVNCDIPNSNYPSDGMFAGSEYTKVVIGEDVTQVGGYAFANCSDLEFVYCLSVNPPKGSSSMFYNNASGLKIYVPFGSSERYKTASGWSTYADCIFEMPYGEDFVNLSEQSTANSYIVSEAGSYKFTPTKGNSSESVGSIASAVVLWETFGTDVTPNVGDLVKNVKYENGVITFETPSAYKEGNAVIAAKDASGTILWSWHIWLTDQPEGQVYYNDAGTMMDRNLGATSATPGDVGALGLLYQWGRKDPFLGSSSISSNTVAKSTLTWPSAVSSDSSNGNIAYATANPTTFITNNSNNYDWYYTGSSSTDNTRWTTSDNNKSIYDPCPVGWRVPDGGGNGVWSKALGSSSYFDYTYDAKKGMNFSGEFGNASTIWYPASGSRYYYGGSLHDVGSGCSYWSASPSNNNAYYLSFYYDGNVYPSRGSRRANGQSVRCLQE